MKVFITRAWSERDTDAAYDDGGTEGFIQAMSISSNASLDREAAIKKAVQSLVTEFKEVDECVATADNFQYSEGQVEFTMTITTEDGDEDEVSCFISVEEVEC